MRGRGSDRLPIVRSDGTTDGTDTEKSSLKVCVCHFARVFRGSIGGLLGGVGRARPDSSRCSLQSGTGLGTLELRAEGGRSALPGRPLSGESRPAFAPVVLTGVVRPGPNGHGGSRPALSIRRNTDPLVELWAEQPISAQSGHKSAQTRQVFEPIATRSRDLLTVSRMRMAFAVGTLSGRLDRQPPHLHLAAAGGRPSIPPHTHTSSPHLSTPPPSPLCHPPPRPTSPRFLPRCRSLVVNCPPGHIGTAVLSQAHTRCLPPLFRPNSPPMALCGSRYPPPSSGHRPSPRPRPSLALLGPGQSALLLPTLRHTPPGPPMDPPTGPLRRGRGDRRRCALRTWTHRAHNITYCP